MTHLHRLLPALLAAPLLMAAAPSALLVAPYLQGGTTTSMVVRWQSAVVTPGRLVVTPAKGGAALTFNGGAGTWHEIKATGLVPGTVYQYEAYDGETRVGGNSFKTNLPASEGRFRFAVMGDSGSGSVHQMAIAKQLTAWKPDFILHCGDVVYERGEAANYVPRFFKPYGELASRAVFYPSLGNHDLVTASGAAYFANYAVPRDAATDTEHWYHFTYGDAEFFALDTNAPFGEGSVQYRWFSQKLAASKAPWKFAFFHHPPYSGGGHGGSPYVRAALVPLFERYNVQIVFSGHDHHYERFKPLEEFVKDGHPTTYLLTGGAGAWIRPAWGTPQTAVVRSAYNFLGIEKEASVLKGMAIGEDGKPFDTWTTKR